MAHEIPADVTVQMYLKPYGDKMTVLLRVPLKALRDIDFPELEMGYLDVERLAPLLPEAAELWLGQALEIREDGVRLMQPTVRATQVSVESDRSFQSYEAALAHLSDAKLKNDAKLVAGQVWVDVLMEYRIGSEQSLFAIRPGMEKLAARVATVVRFLLVGGGIRAYEFLGDPGLVPMDPRWHQAALRFVKLGFFHILDGTDHLLFLLCLVIPFRRLRALVGVVTSFTVAHSITLIASAYGVAPNALWFAPAIETLIAMSILWMALENIVGGTSAKWRWAMAFAFGLVHGFGFSFALRETLQFAGAHLAVSLLSFNVGVELGQLLVLLVLIPVLGGLFRYVVAERVGTIILSALVAHTGWHWMLERFEVLRKFW